MVLWPCCDADVGAAASKLTAIVLVASLSAIFLKLFVELSNAKSFCTAGAIC